MRSKRLNSLVDESFKRVFVIAQFDSVSRRLNDVLAEAADDVLFVDETIDDIGAEALCIALVDPAKPTLPEATRDLTTVVLARESGQAIDGVIEEGACDHFLYDDSPPEVIAAVVQAAFRTAKLKQLVAADDGDSRCNNDTIPFGDGMDRRKRAADKADIRRTALPNKDIFPDMIRGLTAGEEEQAPHSLVMVGLYHMHGVVAHNPPEAVEEIYREIASLLRNDVRVLDSLFEWGEDCFLIFLGPGSDIRRGKRVAERLRRKIEGAKYRKTTQSVTAAFGVADATGELDPMQWVEQAESALEAAFERGGNRVVVYEN